jgi:hypothetical protein
MTAKARWKEIAIVTHEEGRTFTFDGGGVTAGRRAEVIEVLEGTGQVVVTGRYPYRDQ